MGIERFNTVCHTSYKYGYSILKHRILQDHDKKNRALTSEYILEKNVKRVILNAVREIVGYH